MKKLFLLPTLLVFASCASILPGNDPVVVNAERTTALAADTFDSFLKIEATNVVVIKAKAPQIHVYAEGLRRNAPNWLATSRSLTQAYKYNRTAENKVSVQTAIGVLTSAMAETNRYATQVTTLK